VGYSPEAGGRAGAAPINVVEVMPFMLDPRLFARW
jgi:hypothetical protein